MSGNTNVTESGAPVIPKYMTPPKFAEYTGIPLRVVRQMIKDGELTGFKLNQRGCYILTESYKELAHPMIEQ